MREPASILKRGIWVYIFLLLFEGALRKWFLPGLATPLLVIRDPVALYIIFLSWQKGVMPKTPYILWMLLIGTIGFLTAIVIGHRNIFVALYGVRILFIHFPLIFIIGVVFNRSDLLYLGKVLLITSIPMVILVGLQFYSPQHSWVNRGVGGDLRGAGFSGAMGYFRPPATFSFTNGTSLFFSIVGCYISYFWLNLKEINRILLITATVALIASIPLSLSRGLFIQIVIILGFVLLSSSLNPKFFGRIIIGSVIVSLALIFLSSLDFFDTASKVLVTRFENASNSEGSVIGGTIGNRYLGGMFDTIAQSFDQPFFGYGIGAGTNVGSQFLAGERAFLISEGEWGRLIGELGPLLGLGVISLRVLLSIEITLSAFRSLKSGDVLPWLLLSVTLTQLPQGQWAQPTSLGFCTLISGLCISSVLHANYPKEISIK